MIQITKLIRQHKLIPASIEITNEMRSSLNSEGYTQAQWWIINMKSNPPSYLRHDPTIPGRFGNTAFMIWLQVLHFEPPAWMRHDPQIKNYVGDTAEIVWYKFVTTPPPDYIKATYEEAPPEEIDPEASYTTGVTLSPVRQAKILLRNERMLDARKVYKQYKVLCQRYKIPRPMPEVRLHQILTKISRKDITEEYGVVYILDAR